MFGNNRNRNASKTVTSQIVPHRVAVGMNFMSRQFRNAMDQTTVKNIDSMLGKVKVIPVSDSAFGSMDSIDKTPHDFLNFSDQAAIDNYEFNEVEVSVHLDKQLQKIINEHSSVIKSNKLDVLDAIKRKLVLKYSEAGVKKVNIFKQNAFGRLGYKIKTEIMSISDFENKNNAMVPKYSSKDENTDLFKECIKGNYFPSTDCDAKIKVESDAKTTFESKANALQTMLTAVMGNEASSKPQIEIGNQVIEMILNNLTSKDPDVLNILLAPSKTNYDELFKSSALIPLFNVLYLVMSHTIVDDTNRDTFRKLNIAMQKNGVVPINKTEGGVFNNATTVELKNLAIAIISDYLNSVNVEDEFKNKEFKQSLVQSFDKIKALSTGELDIDAKIKDLKDPPDSTNDEKITILKNTLKFVEELIQLQNLSMPELKDKQAEVIKVKLSKFSKATPSIRPTIIEYIKKQQFTQAKTAIDKDIQDLENQNETRTTFLNERLKLVKFMASEAANECIRVLTVMDDLKDAANATILNDFISDQQFDPNKFLGGKRRMRRRARKSLPKKTKHNRIVRSKSARMRKMRSTRR